MELDVRELNYALLSRKLVRLHDVFSVHSDSIGFSVTGRQIFAFCLGNPRHAPVFAATFHGMENITGMLLLNFAERLLRAWENREPLCGIPVRDALRKRGVWIIPCVNPDGMEIRQFGVSAAGLCWETVDRAAGSAGTQFWQANAHGVDINHNFNAGWELLRKMEESEGICGPAPTRFGGYCAESEPETKALVHFCRKRQPAYALAFHSQGEEIYWNYGQHTPQRAEEMARTLAGLSGYRMAQPEGLASMGGFKDWFIEKLCRPAFTIEIGRGKNPLPPTDLLEIYPRLEPMLARALVL